MADASAPQAGLRSATRSDTLRRLDRVLGQGRRVRTMIEEAADPSEILQQLQAIRGAFGGLELLVLTELIDGLYTPCELDCPISDERLKILRETLRHHVGGR